jgi:hypothetical protein
MTGADLRAWVLAFLVTQLVELPLYLLAQRRSSRPVHERVAIAFAASAITHPVAWFVGPVLAGPSVSFSTFFAVVEASVVVAEGAWLAAFAIPRALGWSLLANAASAGLGLLWVRLA